jgi:hypothetical protein
VSKRRARSAGPRRWLPLVGLAVAGAALIGVALLAVGPPPAEPAARNVKGSASAPVVVEEWGDFQ